MRFYGVVTSFYDSGKVTSAMCGILDADEKPKNSFKETITRDIYIDWFDSKEEAESFAEEAVNA